MKITCHLIATHLISIGWMEDPNAIGFVQSVEASHFHLIQLLFIYRVQHTSRLTIFHYLFRLTRCLFYVNDEIWLHDFVHIRTRDNSILMSIPALTFHLIISSYTTLLYLQLYTCRQKNDNSNQSARVHCTHITHASPAATQCSSRTRERKTFKT